MKQLLDEYVPKESEVLTSCLRYLNGVGIFAWRVNNVGIPRKRGNRMVYAFHGMRGISDICGVLNDSTGRILCVEVKRPGKLSEQSEYQQEFQKNIEKDKGIYLLVDSWDMLDKKLKEMGIIK